MAFFPSRAIVVVLLFLLTTNSACSSDLDQELRSSLEVNQLALKEQSFALAHHSQALNQLLQTRERNQLDSQRVSQALGQMAQEFQATISQLSLELSSLVQLSKELATQQSSSFRELTEMAENIQTSQRFVSERIASSQRNVTEELVETITTLLNQKSETTNEDLCQTLTQVTTLPSEAPPQVTTLPSPSVSPEPQVVSDGTFLVVKQEKNWRNARKYCQRMGGDLAIPPSDMVAFQTFVQNAIGGKTKAWLGAREHGSPGYKYVDGVPVQTHHWNSRYFQPDDPLGCLYIHAAYTPPLFDATCGFPFYFICGFA